MYRGGHSNPYAGLSEGIQNGLATLANSQVKLAEIKHDREIRDRDYQQRLQEFDANERQRGIVNRLNQAQENRVQKEYEDKLRDQARSEWSGIMAEIQGADGNKDPVEYERKKKYVAHKMMDLMSRSEYMKSKVSTEIKRRTNGEFDSVEWKHVPGYGDILEVYDSSNPSKPRGVLTDNASTDPNDPVSKYAADDIISLSGLIGGFALDGASPTESSYLLGDNSINLDDSPPTDSVVYNTSQQDSTAAAPTGGATKPPPLLDRLSNVPSTVQQDPGIAPASGDGGYTYIDPARVRKEHGVTAALGAVARNNFEAGKEVLTPVGEFGSKVASTTANLVTSGVRDAVSAVSGFGPNLSAGWNNGKTTETAAPVESAPKAPSEDRLVVNELNNALASKNIPKDPTTPDEISAFTTSVEGQALLRETEADRRGLARLYEGQKVSNRQLNRFLLVATARGDITPAQAASYKENAQGRASDIAMTYFKSPSAAQVLFEVSRRGGTSKGKETNYDKEVLNASTQLIDKAQAHLKPEERMDVGTLGMGVSSAMVYSGNIHPKDQLKMLQKNGHQVASAITDASEGIKRGYYEGYSVESVMSMKLMSKLRGVEPPPGISPEDKIAYENQMLEILKAYPPYVAGYAVDVYRAEVGNGSKGVKIPLEEIDRKATAVFKQVLAEKEARENPKN